MRSHAYSTARSWCGLVVALVCLGTLVFGGVLEYYGDVDPQEYRWKGPVGAALILTVVAGAVTALQRSSLPGWVRGLGYAAVAALGTTLSFHQAAHYYETRCGDPRFDGECGLPLLAATGWAAIAAVCFVAAGVAAEALRHRRPREPACVHPERQ